MHFFCRRLLSRAFFVVSSSVCFLKTMKEGKGGKLKNLDKDMIGERGGDENVDACKESSNNARINPKL